MPVSYKSFKNRLPNSITYLVNHCLEVNELVLPLYEAKRREVTDCRHEWTSETGRSGTRLSPIYSSALGMLGTSGAGGLSLESKLDPLH